MIEPIIENNPQRILKDARIHPDDVIDKPMNILSVKSGDYNSIICTYGNLSAIIGKAKGRKTALCTIFASVVGGNNIMIERFTLEHHPQNVIWFDTEQSDFYVHRIVSRVKKISSREIEIYCLRPYTAEEKLVSILHRSSQVDNSFIIIDGIKDIVRSINNEEEANDIVQRLMHNTATKNNHIMCVIHQNKSREDANARGWLGTEIMNKSETVISVNKDSAGGNYSVVSAEFLRDRDFNDFYITFEDGTPCLTKGDKSF